MAKIGILGGSGLVVWDGRGRGGMDGLDGMEWRFSSHPFHETSWLGGNGSSLVSRVAPYHSHWYQWLNGTGCDRVLERGCFHVELFSGSDRNN